MKIIFISDAIYPYNKGGKEKRLFEISTRLAKKGYDVHIYCMKWWNRVRADSNRVRRGDRVKLDDDIRVENGVHLHAISKYYPLYSGDRRSIKQAILFGLNCWKLIIENFDIIDVDHMPFFPLFTVKLICLLKKKKMHATWHEVWGRKYWRKYLGPFGVIGYQIERLSVALPDKIISVSRHTAEKLRTEFKYQGKIVTIPNGIDLEKIKKVRASEEKSDVIFVGRLLKHKNVDILIRAIKLLTTDNRFARHSFSDGGLPTTKCLIIGDGPERNNLIQLAKELNLAGNVKFIDSEIKQEEVYALMKSSKVFALPSTREGFGIVVLEANACGIPVITTDYLDNAAKELIKHGENGYLTALDPDSLAGKIRRVLESSALKTPPRWPEGTPRTVEESVKPRMMSSFENLTKEYDWKFVISKIEKEYRV